MRLRRALGAGGDRDDAARLPAGVLADEVDAHASSGWSGGPRAADAGRAGTGGVRARRGVGAVAGPAARRPRGLGAGADRGGPARGAAPRCRGAPPRRLPASGQHREVLAEAQARVAEAPLRERRWALLAAGPVPGRPPGRGAAHAAPGPHRAGDRVGLDPGPELVALEQAILRQDPALVRRRPTRRGQRGLPVPRSRALRRRRCRGVLRARRRGRRVSAPADGDRRARRGRAVGGGKSSLVRAGRRGGAAARRPPGRRRDAWRPPDGRAHGVPVGRRRGAGRRPVRGGGHAVRRSG